MHKKVKFLEQSFDELNATHERLIEAHEKLGKAHSSLIEQVKKEEVDPARKAATAWDTKGI